MTDSNINDLCPELKTIYTDWLNACHAVALAAKATVTWRSTIDQNVAKVRGLSNAGAGESPHNCCNPDGSPASRAFDFAIFDKNAQYVKDGTDPRYAQAAEIGKKLGLVWGGDWNSFPDYDHLELANWKTEQVEPVTT